jgi:hypothetical protein
MPLKQAAVSADGFTMQVIALVHEPSAYATYLVRELAAHAQAARGSGLRVHTLPIDLGATDPETALGWLDFQEPVLGVLSTYIQRDATYHPLYEAALGRGIQLLHTPQQNSRLMEFGLFYPHIEDLTARSVVVTDPHSLQRAIDELTFPVFTKGQIKSVKEQGWDACVAKTPDDLRLRAEKWGEVVAREILDLRSAGSGGELFPHFREYRAYWLDGQIIGKEYYWDGDDPFGPLADEEAVVDALVHEAAGRMDTPFVSVDVGQLVDGSWRVIEIGDPQYSGICHMSRYACWQKLIDYARELDAPTRSDH